MIMKIIRLFTGAFLALLMLASCGTAIQPQDSNPPKIAVGTSENDLVKALTDKVAARLAATMPATDSFDPGTWNDFLSVKESLEEFPLVQIKIIQACKQQAEGLQLVACFKVEIENVFWGNVKKGETIFISQSLESAPGRYIYQPNQRIIVRLSNRNVERQLEIDNSVRTVLTRNAGYPLYIEDYNGIEYALDYFCEDLCYELYDRGLIKTKNDAIITNDSKSIVKKELLYSLFALRSEYQTGKWNKAYSWQMENGTDKEAALAEEEKKLITVSN
jgi:hypothetical protein